MSLTGPDMSLDMHPLIVSDDIPDVHGSKSLAVGLSDPLG